MKKIVLRKIRGILAGFLVASIILGNSVLAVDNVTPDIETMLSPGESISVNKEVVTPEIAPKLDFVLLVDMSNSYYDDIDSIRALDSDLFDNISMGTTDLQVGLASFIDYPEDGWGAPTDYSFQVNQTLTDDKTTWTTAIDNLVLGLGYDEPESQYAGLKGTAENFAWREGAKRVIAITTDASFHVPSDGGGTYPGPSREDTISALNAQGITVIALKAPGSGTEMDDIAAETGGYSLPTTASSSDIAEKILEGLSNLPITVSADTSDCGVLSVALSPSEVTVTSGDPAIFEELITVPNDSTLQGKTLACKVLFKDEDGNIIGVEKIVIYVPDTTPPIVECRPTTNPNGNNIPKAGEKSKGQNEDGFYQVLAFDNVDESVEIYVNGFGPFQSYDKLKITEALGTEPKIKKIGTSSATGSADAVTAHLILNSDALITATDSAGNTSTITCLVPPTPK